MCSTLLWQTSVEIRPPSEGLPRESIFDLLLIEVTWFRSSRTVSVPSLGRKPPSCSGGLNISWYSSCLRCSGSTGTSTFSSWDSWSFSTGVSFSSTTLLALGVSKVSGLDAGVSLGSILRRLLRLALTIRDTQQQGGKRLWGRIAGDLGRVGFSFLFRLDTPVRAGCVAALE